MVVEDYEPDGFCHPGRDHNSMCVTFSGFVDVDSDLMKAWIKYTSLNSIIVILKIDYALHHTGGVSAAGGH